MGGEPVSWSEIKAWKELTHTPLAVWEARLLKKLSMVYLSTYRASDGEDVRSPVEIAND